MSSDWVECRSDHDYIGRPLAFSWQGKRMGVAEVLAQNRTPGGYQFRVRAENSEFFELDYDSTSDQWSVFQI